MVSETTSLEVAGAIRRIYSESEIRLFEIIARRLARGIDSPGWAGAKASEVLALRRDLERQIGELTRTGTSTIDEAIATAYDTGEVAAVSDLRGAVRVSGAFGGGNPASIAALAAETVRVVDSTHVRILREAMDIYRSVVAESVGSVLTGSSTRRQASQRILDRFATQGITGFVDTAGRSWEAASYAEMATRTAVMRAGTQGYADTLVNNDSDLVIVSTSPRSCPRCDVWEGQVLSLTGRTRDYPTLNEAVGAGLHHPNCRHREHLYQPGITQPPPRRPPQAEREALYKAEQRQRYNERQIRAWKRREAAALDEPTRRKASVKVRAWQGEQRRHLEGFDLRRLYEREQVIGPGRAIRPPPPLPIPDTRPITARVYHGTNAAPFTTPDPSKFGSATDAGFLGRGFYGSTDPAVGSNRTHILSFDVHLDNPIRVEMQTWGSSKSALVSEALGSTDRVLDADEITALARKLGHDGVVLDYKPLGYDHKEIAIFDLKKIKGRGLYKP